jgi:ubiquinone/menaquinone biosynthesis C-methylase UbiE
MSTLTLAPGIESLKSRLRTTWMAGDYDRFSRFMENDARSFYERLDVPPGAHLLDIACGSGQLALIAAREGVRVTGVDIADNLIERAQTRSMAEALPARFQVADTESLPFPDSSFDVVVSLIGAMLAPRPHLVARELTRVCTPGGTIAMANWTAGGFVGKMFNTIARFIAPSGMPSPLLWGEEDVVRERFGSQVCELRLARRHFTFDYPFRHRTL